MSERSVLRKVRGDRSQGGAKHGSAARTAAPAPARSGPLGPLYAAGPAFGLGKPVQTKVAIGEPGDPHEKEADRAADSAVSGQKVPKVSTLPAGGLAQRETKPEEKKEQPVQKQSKPEEKKEQPVQKQSKPEEKKEQPVQKQSKPEEKKEQPVQKQSKPEEKKEQPVQKQSKPEEKKEQPVQKQSKPEEKKEQPVQKAAKPEEKKEQPVQKESKPEEKKEQPVQKQEAAGGESQEEAPEEAQEDAAVQEKETGGGAGRGPAAQAAAGSAIAGKGPGQRLAPETRRALEPAFGTDLGDVRVHDDSSAHAAASALNARAFTHGRDIWLGRGESPRDLRLMAHETTHVLQQSGIVRRTNGTGGGGGGGSTATGVVDENASPKTITFDTIEVPGFKVAGHRGSKYSAAAGANLLKRKARYNRGNPNQEPVWRRSIQTGTIEQRLQEKVNREPNLTPPYTFRGPGNRLISGQLPQVARELTVPTWDKAERPHDYDVDHIVELQLFYWDANPSANAIGNMEMLDRRINRSSGPTIAGNIRRKVTEFKTANNRTEGVRTLLNTYDMVFRRATGGGGSVTQNDFWTQDEIERALHMGPVRVNAHRDGTVYVFSSAAGTVGTEFQWQDGAQAGVRPNERDWLAPFRITAKQFNTQDATSADFGSLTISIPADDPTWEPIPAQAIPVQRIPGAQFAGSINEADITSRLASLRKKGLSPVRISRAGVHPGGGLEVSGEILPDIPLFQALQIQFELRGNDLRVYKEFDTGAFNVPPPFRVTDSSLTLSIGTRSGIGIEGQVDFEIMRAGRGYLRGSASTGEGFGLEGQFNFDSDLFDPAQITLRYQNREFSGEGRLGIRPGKVRGIRSASVQVSYANQRLTATGTVQPQIPGIQQGDIEVQYSEEEGFMIFGRLQLAQGIPGIRSGSVELRLRKTEAGWSVQASGTAVPNIPGVSTQLTIGYDNGAITIEGSASYSRGMLTGTVTVGATNRPVNDQGQPAGEPGDELRAFGGGRLTLRLAPWLQASVGVRILPNGELEVSGEVGLPSAVNLFDRKELNKEILSVNFNIPIVPGLMFTVGGGLSATAGIGPGQLTELGLAVTYNPAHEDQTTITGRAKLRVPMDAGLRLAIRAGLGLGIPGVSVSGGLEVGGRLGLDGALEAGVEVNWTPASGLRIDAAAEMYVQPKMRFDISGFVRAEALFFTVYENRWELAAFEFGSDMRFGIKFPVKYEEGRPFDLSLSDVEFITPSVSPGQLVRDLIDRII